MQRSKDKEKLLNGDFVVYFKAFALQQSYIVLTLPCIVTGIEKKEKKHRDTIFETLTAPIIDKQTIWTIIFFIF